MLQAIMKDLRGCDIIARDGAIGSVRDAYFDDESWAVRYLVVDTGNWLPGRRVLISPRSISRVENGNVCVDLSRDQVEHAPGVDEHETISRLYEEAHALHYGYPYYWSGPYLWGPVATPAAASAPTGRETGELQRLAEAGEQAEREAAQSHLRSMAEVVGYQIQALDGSIGHVEDFLVDDRNWAVASMLLDTRDWLPGKTVRVPPASIAQVDWANRQVDVNLTRDEIEQFEQV